MPKEPQIKHKEITSKMQLSSKPTPTRFRSQSVDFDGVFDIDFDEGNAFDSISYSDDEEEDEGLAFSGDYNRDRAQESAKDAHINAQRPLPVGHMALSLPIQVPQWHQHALDIDQEEDVSWSMSIPMKL